MSGRQPAAQRGATELRADDRGMVALEFALLSPVFLLLIFGVMVFTIYFAILVAVIHASAEGARASVVGLSDAERGQFAQTRVTQVFQGYAPLLDPGQVQTTTGVGPAAGTYTVKVAYSLSGFDFGVFYRLLGIVAGSAPAAPSRVSHAETVANGGY